MNMPSFLALLSTALLIALAPPVAQAQAGASSQPLRIVVATPPGGASDAAARLLGESLARRLGHAVIVENRPGGNGVPAIQAVLGAAPDGRTLLWAMSSMTGMPLLVKSPPVKSMSEFVPVVPVVNVVYGLVVNPDVPARTVGELTAYLKANPGRVNYGTGVLSEYMLTAHYLQAAGVKAQWVPYKGGAQVMPDLVRGEIQFNLGPLTPALPHVKAGKLRLLATLPGRDRVIPDVPALAEAGIVTESLPTWNGLMAPPRTPPEIATRLAQEVTQALAEPALRTALEAQGFRVTGGTPRQMAEAVDSAAAIWRQFVHDYDVAQE